MSTVAHAKTREFATWWDNLLPSAVFSGIVPDAAHLTRGGPHVSIEDQSASNYSVTRPDDKAPPGNWPRNLAGAIDMSMNRADMITTYNRVYAVWADQSDPRRQYFNGWNVYSGSGAPRRLDFYANTNTAASSDHTWHTHGEPRRRYVDGDAFYDAARSMLSGESKADYVARHGGTTPAPPPPPYVPTLRRQWPGWMPKIKTRNQWNRFGLITGPVWLHGGYYANERPDVKAIQQELIRQGFVPGITNVNSSWADGRYESETVQAVKRFQAARMPGTTYPGEFWEDDWRNLFTY